MLKSVVVKEYMSANLVTLKPNMRVDDAISLLIENRVSGAPVVDNLGNLVGMFSEKDCMRVALTGSYFGECAGKVAEYMQTEVKAVGPEESVVEVASIFVQDGFPRYPVVMDNLVVGLISRRDVLKALGNLCT